MQKSCLKLTPVIAVFMTLSQPYARMRSKSQFPERWRLAKYSNEETSLWNFWDSRPVADWTILYWGLLATCPPYLVRAGYRVAEVWEG